MGTTPQKKIERSITIHGKLQTGNTDSSLILLTKQEETHLTYLEVVTLRNHLTHWINDFRKVYPEKL